MPTTHRALVTLLLAVAFSTQVCAQQIRGTVLDSASRRPLASAVVMYLGATGTMLGRSITDERGAYASVAPSAAQRVRVQRLGYRAREVPLPPAASGASFDIALLAIPALLEPVSVEAASSCPRRPDGPAALALLEQAYIGLLATIVAREANPAAIKLIAFTREMEGTSERIRHQTVRMDSSRGRTNSFAAVATGSDFVDDGFVREQAETLLSDGFARGYCFRIHDPDRGRPSQVGLAFAAATDRKGRVDIDGTLWVDTVARALSDIEFRYVGLPHSPGAPELGGRIGFREMPNGMVLIDRWFLRLATMHVDSSRGRSVPPRVWFEALEQGGEVARATWPDGKAWTGSLGAVHLHVATTVGTAVTTATVRLGDSDYRASTDAHGDAEILDVLPGPYDLVISDTALAPATIAVGIPMKLTVPRNGIAHATIAQPPVNAFLEKKCLAVDERRWVQATVVRRDTSPAVDARWEVGEDLAAATPGVSATGRSDAEGKFGFCVDTASRFPLQMRVWESLDPRRVVILFNVGARPTIRIELPESVK